MIGKRFKFLHSVGLVSKFKYETVANAEGYTGIFESGCDNGIMRFSTATNFDSTKTSAEGAWANFIPGIALKFLRNGVHSGNLVAMYSVNG